MLYKLLKSSFIFLLIGAGFLLVQCSTGSDQKTETKKEWKPGDVYKGEDGWIEARVGDMPLVISAPHGGTLKPEGIANRNCPGIVTVRDMNTIELALEVEQELKSKYDVGPYIILNHLHRSKLDMNRAMKEATCGHSAVEAPWHQYHAYIEEALSEAVEKFGFAVFIDLHGHGHDKQRLELGYALNKEAIKDNYIDPGKGDALASKSSLLNLLRLKDQESDHALKQLLTGSMAFGTLMENEGVAATPSKQDPYPLIKDSYFSGGYNTRRYTSANHPNVFGWQIETNYKGIRDSGIGRQRFAKAFTKAITLYIEEHMDYKPK